MGKAWLIGIQSGGQFAVEGGVLKVNKGTMAGRLEKRLL